MDALGIMLDAGRVVQADKDVVIDSLAKEGSSELQFLDFVAYNDFDIIFDPDPTHHERRTAVHAPRGVLYLAAIVFEC